MRHEDNEPIHPRDREQYLRRREQRGFQHEGRFRRGEQENFNDFSSRWGHPEIPFEPRERDQRYSREHYSRNRIEKFRDDWRPFEQEIEEYEREHHDRYRPDKNAEEQEARWRQRDMYFDRDNQHANDRWQRNAFNPPPPNFRERGQEPPKRRRYDRDRDR